MVRIAAFTLVMAVVALTGFASAENKGRGGQYDCNNCQLFARSDKHETRREAMKCVRQVAEEVKKRYEYDSTSKYVLSPEKSTRAHVGNTWDVIKKAEFKQISFFPDHNGGLGVNDIKCDNGMTGFAVCKNCIDASNP